MQSLLRTLEEFLLFSESVSHLEEELEEVRGAKCVCVCVCVL